MSRNVLGLDFGSRQKKHSNAQGVPSLTLDGSFQTGAPAGQNVTRLEVFMEMVQ